MALAGLGAWLLLCLAGGASSDADLQLRFSRSWKVEGGQADPARPRLVVIDQPRTVRGGARGDFRLRISATSAFRGRVVAALGDSEQTVPVELRAEEQSEAVVAVQFPQENPQRLRISLVSAIDDRAVEVCEIAICDAASVSRPASGAEGAPIYYFGQDDQARHRKWSFVNRLSGVDPGSFDEFCVYAPGLPSGGTAERAILDALRSVFPDKPSTLVRMERAPLTPAEWMSTPLAAASCDRYRLALVFWGLGRTEARQSPDCESDCLRIFIDRLQALSPKLVLALVTPPPSPVDPDGTAAGIGIVRSVGRQSHLTVIDFFQEIVTSDPDWRGHYAFDGDRTISARQPDAGIYTHLQAAIRKIR
jgi:hypothetical protein